MRRECFTPELTAAFAADPWGLAWDFAPPGGESQRQVEQRMSEYLVQQVLPHVRPDAPAIVVSHGEGWGGLGAAGWLGDGLGMAGQPGQCGNRGCCKGSDPWPDIKRTSLQVWRSSASCAASSTPCEPAPAAVLPGVPRVLLLCCWRVRWGHCWRSRELQHVPPAALSVPTNAHCTSTLPLSVPP